MAASNANAGAGDSGARQKVHRSGKNAANRNSRHQQLSQGSTSALVTALERNLARASEPELRQRLAGVIARLQTKGRRPRNG
jgi:hypothetical protein